MKKCFILINKDLARAMAYTYVFYETDTMIDAVVNCTLDIKLEEAIDNGILPPNEYQWYEVGEVVNGIYEILKLI